MPRSDSERAKHFLEARSRDLTTAAVRHAAHVLYAPVSNNPELTGCCASILSDTELRRADRFIRPGDRSLFIQRRAFRRFCAARSLGSSKPLCQFIFEETENGRPHLREQPAVWFSFSSCRFGFLGAWSSTHSIGVDIEDQTRDPGATELASQYFSGAEARALVRQDGQANLQSFFQYWSLKEAALKSIGEGLPYGLDAFEFELEPVLRIVQAPADHGGPGQFSAHMIEGTDNCAVMVIRDRLV